MFRRVEQLARIAIPMLGLAAGAAAQLPVLEKLRAALPPDPVGEREDPRRVVGPGLFAHQPPLLEAMSTDRSWFASTDASGNLLVRSLGGEPEQLAAAPDGCRWSVEGARWSPDSKWLAARTFDDREVAAFVIGNGKDGQRTVRYSYAGTPLPEKRLYLLARDGGARREVPLTLDYVHPVGWTSDGAAFRFLESNRVNRLVALRSVDRETGAVSTLMEERSERWSITGLDLGDGYSERFARSNMLVFVDDDRFLWQSDRSGERHLWDYRPGVSPRKLTEGLDGVLLDVPVVLPERGVAALLVAAEDAPWATRRLERLDLDSCARRVLLEAPDLPFVEWVDGVLVVAEGGLPARFALRYLDLDGAEVKARVTADLAFLGDEPVEFRQLTLPSAEGETMLEALLVLPKGASADAPVPLIESIYGGPHTTMVPRIPLDYPIANALIYAHSGFATLFVDARGTPGRGAAFRHAQDGRFGATVIPDHATALRRLLADEPAIDPDRVGIIGHSWGGYFALRAMIEAPDLYRSAIMLSPAIDVSHMRVPIEAYQGCLPTDCADAYRQGDLSEQLERVRGPLMIVQGRADDDVLPEVVEALQPKLASAGVEHEVVWLDRANHAVQLDPGHMERVLGFFRRTLAK